MTNEEWGRALAATAPPLTSQQVAAAARILAAPSDVEQSTA